MRETVLSNCEKSFVEKAIVENLRIDKRDISEFRNVGLNFGRNFGSVLCSLGETRVFAQVSCELSTPKATRPNEGTIFINVELGPMAAPHLEVGFPLSKLCIQVNRILERTLRESRCVDLESLCIIAAEKVWNLRVDIAVLNHEGNVMDCSCIAAVAALAHFKRPDVTTTGDGSYIIHTPAEKDLIPTVLHHYPICSSYALFQEGKLAVSDPTALEERVSDASLVLAVNSYKELCCMHLAGVALTSPSLILKCSEMAASRSRRIVEFIKATLEEDIEEREKGNLPKGFAEVIKLSNIPSNFHAEESIGWSEERVAATNDSDEEMATVAPLQDHIKKIDSKTVVSGQWEGEESSSGDSSNEDVVEVAPPAKVEKSRKRKPNNKKAKDESGSEEDETIEL